MSYLSMSKEELLKEYELLKVKFDEFKALDLSVDMSRGKPASPQLDLSNDMLNSITVDDLITMNGTDVRNYGGLDGLPEMKAIFADILSVAPENIIVGENSSLNMMYDTIARAMFFGIMGSEPWNKQGKIKFLCPVPGYDRHFGICEAFGIEMINIPMLSDGPDMDLVAEYVENDSSVKGIWSVPAYSNPTGITYSDEVVRKFAALKPAAKDFRIFWDNAYCVHHIKENPDKLLNIFDACKEYGSEDMVYEFVSTSKISFSGAGVAAMAASEANVKEILKHLSSQTIGPNKINQLMHVKFFKSADGIREHMQKHRKFLEPKFNAVIKGLNEGLGDLEIATYTNPNGGYFISFQTMKGCAKRVGELCKELGLVITSVGATYPYGVDPDDSNIRIAPTYPPIDELNTSITVFVLCVKLASIEKLLADK